MDPSCSRSRPRILYLADRNIFWSTIRKHVMFSLWGCNDGSIENGDASKSREMYFPTYQSIAEDDMRPLYRDYGSREFFDLVIVDVRHTRGMLEMKADGA